MIKKIRGSASDLFFAERQNVNSALCFSCQKHIPDEDPILSRAGRADGRAENDDARQNVTVRAADLRNP